MVLIEYPADSYFQANFDANTGELKDSVKAFKAARYCDPVQLNEPRPTPADIDSLTAFGFIDANFAGRLKDELPSYLAAIDDISPEIDVTNWWKNRENELASWAAA